MSTVKTYADVIEFWLGDLDAYGQASPEVAARWWRKDPAFDRAIGDAFAPTYEAIVAGRCDGWLETPAGRLGYILVLDQLARNMFRDTPKMFAADPLARRATHEGFAKGHDRMLPLDGKVFFYMPLMHSEHLEDQEQCVALFEALAREAPAPARPRLAENHRFAIAHRDIIARFGRFPHRNAILGRASTDEELAFLEQPGSSF